MGSVLIAYFHVIDVPTIGTVRGDEGKADQELGSAEVAPASEPTLREIAKILSLNPERCVLVEGHTDATGNAERNLELSHRRAGSVVKFIVEKSGIDRNRLVPIGKGSSDPMKNIDPRDKKNRRVVFKVVG